MLLLVVDKNKIVTKQTGSKLEIICYRNMNSDRNGWDSTKRGKNALFSLWSHY